MRAVNADALIPKIKFIMEAENQIYGRGSWDFSGKCLAIVENEPTIEPERKTDGDTISRQPEINCSEIPNTSDFVSRKAVREMVSAWAYDLMEQEDLNMALHDVDELPPAQDFHSDFADLRAEQEERNITSPVLHPVKET